MNVKGTVVKTTGSWHSVQLDDKTMCDCRVRGKFRIKGIRNTNPIAVGDRVFVERSPNEETGVIVDMEKRRNYIIRKATKLSKEAHIIASNIDTVFVVASLVSPETSLMLIDRILVSAEAYRINAVILINKADMLNDDKLELADAYKYIYETVGYKTLLISATTGQNIDQVRELMQNKTSVFVGMSGVGKSTLINYLEPGLQIKTGEISDAHLQGKHTTTFAEMHALSFGGYIIDTPGIRSFGLLEMDKKEELSHYFPEIFKISDQCRFNNCTHTHEPGCAVREAVEENTIPFTRYENYLAIMQGDDDEKYRKDLYG